MVGFDSLPTYSNKKERGNKYGKYESENFGNGETG